MEQQESMLLAAARAGDDMSVARYLKLKWGSSRQRINCNCVDAEGRTPLSLAASRGHIAVVEVLLAAEADLDIADANGKTALSSAAYHDNVAVVEALLAAGADTDRADKSGLTALLEAAMLNRVHVVELLLASGANVDHEDSHGNTALMNAASYGHLRVVNVLLAAGATIDHATRLGETALLLAASDGHTSVVRVLLEAGADPTVTNKRGRTALNYAESSGYKAIADLLRNSAGDPTTAAFSAISRGDLDALKQVLAKETNVRGYNDRTPLYFAASRGRLDMVKYLVATDSTIDYKDFEGDTALIVAARMGHAKVVRLLLEAGASPEIENRDKRTALQEAETHRYKEIVDLLGNYEGSAAATFAAIARDDLDGFKSVVDKHKNARGIHDRTPLHVAASRGRLDMVQLLVDRDVNVNIRDADDWTPLHHACQSGHVAIVNLLLARGSRADAADSEGRPPVVIAVANGHVDVLHELHTSGASLHSVGHDGRTLLHHATSRTDNGSIVEYLLNASNSPAEDVNALDRTKSSPLHHAARTANTAAVALLLSSGADMDAQNEDGETALIIACAGGSAEIVQTLLSNGAKTDLVSVSGETARSAAKSEEIQAAVQLFLNSQRYHERCSELMSSIDTKPTDDDLKELVPLITSAYDLRLFMSLISLTFDGEPAAKCPARGLLLNSALSHVANSKLVFDDDACVFFKLVLDHCKTNSWLTSRELLMLDRQAEKVNNENADWVLELQRKVHDHSWRLDNHEQSLKRVVDGITQVHAMVQENREAIKSVHNRMDNIQAQVDMGKRLLTQVVANGNRLSDHVMHLKERLEESERKVQGVAEGLHNFQNAYVARQEQEQKNKRIKMIGGLLASTVGFVFAPALKEVFDTVIDLANPVEVFNIAFGGEKGIGDFLADKFSEHVLTPFVGDQFEKLMIPQDQFEALLREQIVLQNPELVEECVKQGYAIDVDAYGGSGQAEYALTMQPELESEESVINGLLGELQLAVAGAMTNPNFTNERRSHYEVRSSEDWSVTASRKSIDNQREEEPRFVEQAVEAAKQEVKKEKVKKTEVKKEESKVEKMVKKMEKKEEKKPEPVSSPKRPSLARAPAAGAVPQEPASVDSVSPNAEIVFIEDADEFPFHAAIRESQGQVDEFCELVNVLAGDKDDPSAVMHMQLRSGSTASEESICAAEYAYCLGHKEVGDFLASRMASKVSNTTKATSVELLEDDDEFVYVSIVEGCGGDVDDCEFMCEAIEADGHAIDARIKAKVVRESCVDVKWTAVEYAAHLGYVDIVMKLLKEWSQNLPGKTKIQLMKQAKISARGLTV